MTIEEKNRRSHRLPPPATRRDRAARGAQRPQDTDVLGLFHDDHDQHRGDVERRDQHDHGQDQEHHVALDLERVEEGRAVFNILFLIGLPLIIKLY